MKTPFFAQKQNSWNIHGRGRSKYFDIFGNPEIH